jgi:hypothetical protein
MLEKVFLLHEEFEELFIEEEKENHQIKPFFTLD